jgi:hypothetical protein
MIKTDEILGKKEDLSVAFQISFKLTIMLALLAYRPNIIAEDGNTDLKKGKCDN